MIWLPISLGIAGVLQSALNRGLIERLGMAGAMFVNFVTMAAMAVTFYFIQGQPSFRENLRWTDWIPALCGFLFVSLTPYAISKLGTLTVMTLLVASQILFSFVWDLWIEKLPFSTLRALGALLTIAGACCVAFALRQEGGGN